MDELLRLLEAWRIMRLGTREVVDGLVAPEHRGPSPELRDVLDRWKGGWYWADSARRRLVLVHPTAEARPPRWILHSVLFIDGAPNYVGTNLPLKPRDTLQLDKKGKIRFTVKDGNRQVSCTLWSKPVPGLVQIQPRPNVGVAFNGGTSVCNTPPDARRKWQTWVKKAAAKLTFSDPVFSVVVGRQKSTG